MLKKPKFYPILPRVKLGKTVRNMSNISDSTVQVRVKQIHVADRLVLTTGEYTPKYFNVDRDITFETCSRSGTKLPGWRQVVAKGGNATNPYSRKIVTHRPTSYKCYSYGSVYQSRGYGVMYGGLHNLQPDTTALSDQALGRLKNRLNGNIGKAQLAAPLAESREIHRLVRQINGIGLSTLKAALAIKKTRGKSAFKQFGDIWLGFGFGVNPLIKDVASAANAILDYTTREDHSVVVRGTATREYTSSTTTIGADDIAWAMKMGHYNSHFHTQGIRIVAGIDLKLRTAASYSVPDHLGLEVGQIPSVLWELTPFSWVVDYFATVGPWLDDMFFTLPGVTKYVSVSSKYQCDSTSRPYPIFNDPVVYRGWLSGSDAVSRYVIFGRASLSALPSRALRIKSVDEIANNGVSKLLNLASVFAQKHGGPRL